MNFLQKAMKDLEALLIDAEDLKPGDYIGKRQVVVIRPPNDNCPMIQYQLSDSSNWKSFQKTDAVLVHRPRQV